MYLIFKNKKFVSYSETATVPGPEFEVKEIPEDQRDLRVWKWEGDLEDGKMINMWEKDYPQEELDEEKRLLNIIYEEYPPGIQLTRTIIQLYKLANHLNLLESNFADMAEVITKAVEMQEKRFNFYSKQFSTNNE